jgi:hypothetical protein
VVISAIAWPVASSNQRDEQAYIGFRRLERNMSRAAVAAVLSFIVPGFGQIYNGDILRGLFWLIITPGFWVGSGGTLGWVCHVIAAATAHHRAHLREMTAQPLTTR